MEKPRILVVDDLYENLISIEAILLDEDYQLDMVQSGDKALEMTLAYEYAVILLDVQMPEMDGFTLARYLKGTKKTKYIPIIFITANLNKDLAEFGYKEGAVDYIIKPVEPVFLRSKVKVFVDLFVQRKIIEEQKDELDRLNQELQKRLEEIKVLQGFIPICASCKKVKNLEGMWDDIEHYIESRSDVEFSHSLCPECMEKLYPDIYKRMKQNKAGETTNGKRKE